jgi:hypothetical protein
MLKIIPAAPIKDPHKPVSNVYAGVMMREVKTLVWLGVFVFIGMVGLTGARLVEDSPAMQSKLKTAFNIDSFYANVK